MTTQRPVASDVDPATLQFDDRGLLPVIAQDISTGTVLMLAWADQEAVQKTLESGEAWFWSRSRQELWRKGATSGNVLEVVEVAVDCDADSLLYQVHPAGPSCHLGSRSCFESQGEKKALGELELGWLWRVLEARQGADPESSYTARLLAKGRPRIAQKVVEEAGEVVIASLTMGSDGDSSAALDATDEGRDELVGEAADLLYHLMVLLLDSGVPPRLVAERLVSRHRPNVSTEAEEAVAVGEAS